MEGHSSREISVVVPTIPGRESWARKCVREYKRTAPQAEIIVIKDEPSCGHAWVKGFEESTRKYIHFTADDITPADGWWGESIDLLDRSILPAANVRDQNGAPAMCDSPLGDMGLYPNILVPFLTREMAEKGNWLLPIHYGSDDWFTYRAVSLGYPVERCRSYRMFHHVAPEGRDYTRRHADVKQLADAMKSAGYLPPVYEMLEVRLRSSLTGLDSVSLVTLSARSRRQQKLQEGMAARGTRRRKTDLG